MKFCINCGKKISQSNKFCPYCGAKQMINKADNGAGKESRVHHNVRAAATSPVRSETKRDAYGYTRRSGESQTQAPQTQIVQPVMKKQITPPECSFVDAFKLFWENFANFGGYSSRSEFWWWFLIEEIINVVFWFHLFSSGFEAGLDSGMDGGVGDPSGMISSIMGSLGIAVIWYLVILIPNLSLRTRRFRDAGVTNGWIIALLIIDYVPAIVPFVGWFIWIIARIATLVIECMPSVRKVIASKSSK